MRFLGISDYLTLFTTLMYSSNNKNMCTTLEINVCRGTVGLGSFFLQN